MDVVVRDAKNKDLIPLSSLAVTFAEANPSPSSKAIDDLSKNEQALNVLLSTQNTRVLVAEVSNEIVGVIVLFEIPSFVHGGRTTLFVDLLVVDKRFRRKGIAKLLVKRAIKEAKNSKSYKVLLVFHKGNESAKKLYENCGFKENGIAFAYYI